eukprot:1193212-Prorocentrum_minimum.AAC.12
MSTHPLRADPGVCLVHRENIPTLPASDWSIVRIYSCFLRPIGPEQDRRVLSVAACLAWSAATASMGAADSFEHLLVVRSLMGLAMAVSAPAAYSLIAEIAPPGRLASATSVYAGKSVQSSPVQSSPVQSSPVQSSPVQEIASPGRLASASSVYA